MVIPDSERVIFRLSQENKRIRKTRERALPDSRGYKAPRGEQEVTTVIQERPTGWLEHPGRDLSGQPTPVSF